MKKSAAKCIADHKLTDKTDKAFFDTYKKQAADNGATPEEAAQIGIDEVIANLKREKEYVLGEIEKAGLQVPQSILDSLVIHEVDNDIQAISVKDIKAEKEIPENKHSFNQKQAKEDLDQALSDLGEIFEGFTTKGILPTETEQKLLPVLTRLMDAAFRLGYYKFRDNAKYALDIIREKLGDQIADSIDIDHFQGAYIGMSKRYQDTGDVTPKTEVVTIEDINVTEGIANDESTLQDQDATGSFSQQPDNQTNARTQSRRDGQASGQTSERNGNQRQERQGDSGVSTGSTIVSGKQSDINFSGKTGELPSNTSPTHTGDSRGSTNSSSKRVSSEREGSNSARTNATETAQLELKKPTTTEFKAADIDNIRSSLPQLFPEQQDDVLFAEQRLFNQNGHGVLFTNGTGTGKTFTGLGVVKRYDMQGKNNIIITVPGEKVADDWIKSGKVLGLNITKLSSTKDAGKGIVVTTYANFGQNDAIMDRDWDLVIHDEAHKLSENKDGNPSKSLHTSRAITGHKKGYRRYAEAKERDLLQDIDRLESELKIAREEAKSDDRAYAIVDRIETELNPKRELWRKKLEEHNANREQLWQNNKVKRLDLSATPFAYVKNVDLAEGYLFDYGPEPESRGYNTPDARGAFFIEHFGYRMRYGKLTEPEAAVDNDLMEREFNSWLKQEGALKGRRLEVDKDYSREFVAIDDLIGNKIDDGWEWISERASDMENPLNAGFYQMLEHLQSTFTYHERIKLLEAIKAPHAIERAKKHIKLGRKVVLFHSRIQGGTMHPFQIFEELPTTLPPELRRAPQEEQQAHIEQVETYNAAVNQFNTERADLVNLDISLARPLDLFEQEFGESLVFYNGTVKKSDKIKNPDIFNHDKGKIKVIVVQDEGGKEGISLHDTTGQNQRVLINLGLPLKPTQAIQIEGRIYRVGQMSDAIFEYFNTGTNFERWTFAGKISQRASTAENLALGEEARALKDAFIDSFENPSYDNPSKEQGIGGKESDRANWEAITPFTRAKTHYFGVQKNNRSRNQREGEDYYATPEPLGFKMVEWANLKSGESALEPSAGHGAIGRYFPENTNNVFIEPSGELLSKLALRAPGKHRNERFEDLPENNKYHAIVLNPPYGRGGAEAAKHVQKAMNHLKNGGRIVALIPEGPAADAKFGNLIYGKKGEEEQLIERIKENRKKKGVSTSDDEKRLRQIQNFHVVAEFGLPNITFERAGTQVKTRVLVIDRVDDVDLVPTPQMRQDINASNINEFFDTIENRSVPERADIKDPVEVLARNGLEVIHEKDINEYWIKGKTINHRESMRKAGLNWDSYLKRWYAHNDPSQALADALEGKLAPEESQEIDSSMDGDGLTNAGLKVTKTKTNNGNDVWEVSGNTMTHKEAIKRAGGRWYGRKKVWSFYNGDPTDKLINLIGDNQRYSTGNKVKGQNATQLEQSLENKFGPLHKNINIVQNQSQLPSGLNKQGKIIKGVYDDNTGQVWLVADNIEAGQEMNVFNHETGVHAALAKEPFFKDILAQVRDLRKSGDSLVKQAYQHAIKQGVPIKHRAEEALAYLVEANPDLPIVKRYLAKIRSFLYKHFGIARKYIKLNDADLIELAKSSARSWNKAGVTGLGNLGDFGSGDIFLSSKLKGRARPFLARFFNAIAGQDKNFQSPKTDAKDFVQIVEDMKESKQWRGEKQGNDYILMGMVNDELGQYEREIMTIHNADSDKPYITIFPDIGGGGSAAYQMGFAWAHNNNKVMQPDSRITPINRLRRTEAMISSALRYKTTKHLMPHHDQFVGLLNDIDYNRSLDADVTNVTTESTQVADKLKSIKKLAWTEDYLTNVNNLLINSARLISRRLPEVDQFGVNEDGKLTYNDTGKTKQIKTWEDIAAIIGKDRLSKVGIGYFTIKRYALTQEALSLLNGSQSKPRWMDRSLFESIQNRRRTSDLSGRIEGDAIPDAIFNAFAASGAVDNTLYSSGETPKFDNPDPNFELNKRIREQHKGAWDKAKKILQRNLTARGLLPKSVQDLKITRDNNMGVTEIDIGELNRTLEKAVKKAYGKEIHKLTEQEQSVINKALGGNIPYNMDEDVKIAVLAMRQYIDRLSTDYAQILFNEAKQLQADGKDEAAAAKAALLETVANNIGSYINRSYKAFDDPKWYSKVSDDTLNNAREYLLSQYQAKADKYLEWADKAKTKGDTALAQKHRDNARNIENNMDRWAEATINIILKEGTAFDNMEAFIKESKLGAKDLSILKHRKQIAPEIRALLGEYQDPRITFTKSATKMSRLIFNQRFLDKVKEVGIGSFLFTEKDRPVDAYKKIASGENYKPLDGLYTYPEVEQAFKDALGKENLPDWYRTIVQINGAVKYGKTVLSPTTAFRNWMSAFFFTMANGHFNMKHMVKSFQNMRGYFKHEGDLNYLRKLKQLGVVYDTPYAGEMMKLLDDSQIEDKYLSGNIKVREIMGLFTKFYQYGDDFWKIIGFENEVNLLMEYKKLTREQAEPLAAERIRNTYPTYSMTGRWVQKLRRFPLAGTFVSFPAEIIRTSFNMIKALQKDMSDPQLKGLARKRIAGLAIASGFAYALQEIAMSMLGVDDDEEEAIRNLAPKWSRNSNIMPVGRDEKGNLRYFDLSFLDPYNYWKRPINAVLREQPADKMAKDIAREMLEPFFGQDILFGAINEIWNNKKETGGRIYNPVENALDNSIDIFDHLRKNVQPGIFTNTERMYKAINDEKSPSGKQYNVFDEAIAFGGWRVSTFDPKTAIYYKSYEFSDDLRNASSILNQVARDPNKVDDDDLLSAYRSAKKAHMQAFEKMITLINAAKKSGLTNYDIARLLRSNKISKANTIALMKGIIPDWKPNSRTFMKSTIKRADSLFDEATQKEFIRRRSFILKQNQSG